MTVTTITIVTSLRIGDGVMVVMVVPQFLRSPEKRYPGYQSTVTVAAIRVDVTV